MSRHSVTGSRYDASSLHETGEALRPALLRANTVPENIATIGISPSSSACMYLAAVTSKSYVHAIGRSTSVVSVNDVTTVLTLVHKKGRSVSPQRGASPTNPVSR